MAGTPHQEGWGTPNPPVRKDDGTPPHQEEWGTPCWEGWWYPIGKDGGTSIGKDGVPLPLGPDEGTLSPASVD